MLSNPSSSTTKTTPEFLSKTQSSQVDLHSDTDLPAAQRAQMSSHTALRSPGASSLVGISNTGQQYEQQQDLQVAQQHDQARLALDSPSQSLQQISQASSPQATEQWRKLQHQQLDRHIDWLMKLNTRSLEQVKVQRSQSDQGCYNPQVFPDINPGETSRMMPIISDTSDFANPMVFGGPRPSSSGDIMSNDFIQSLTDWASHVSRPSTPPNQTISAYSPVTPAQTPDSHDLFQTLFNDQFPVTERTLPRSEGQSTVKAGRLPETPDTVTIQRARLQPAFEPSTTSTSRRELTKRLPSPPCTSPLQRHTDATALTDDDATDALPQFTFPPPSDAKVLHLQPGQPFSDNDVAAPIGLSTPHRAKESITSFETHTPSVRGSAPSARSSVDFGADSLLMTPATMALDDLGFDTNMAVEETGISAEEVKAYIAEDFSDNKFPFGCTFPECGKRFGRRENIRSHVQTHLDDRQYRCLECHKRFVRQHDLKRHMKIHTKEKPYKCLCGNGFARQDALTRHRQRGICAGGLAGVVRTPAKRGRPRKNRPNDDERLDKAARQRERNANRSLDCSASGTSGPSQQPSPASTYDNEMDMDGGMSDENIRLLSTASDASFSLSSPDTGYIFTPPMSRDQSLSGTPMKSGVTLSAADLDDVVWPGAYGPAGQGLDGFADEPLFPGL